MKKRVLVPCFLAASLAVWGCGETAVPTSEDGGLIPIDARTVEIRLTFDQFAESLEQLSGFASRSDLPGSLVANQWRGDLDVHSLVRFGLPEDRIFVIPPGSPTQTTVADLNYIPIGGRVVVFLAPDEVVAMLPIELEMSALQAPWHVQSASWDLAVDTLGSQLPWPAPGGDPAVPIGIQSWQGVSQGDSIVFEVDSLTVTQWFDQTRPENGARLAVSAPGTRLRIVDMELVYQVRSSIHPDTTVEISALSRQMTTIYHPESEPLEGAFRIGGAPAHRAVIHFDLPRTAQGNAQACAVVECPVRLDSDRLVYAGLQLHSRESSPLGLQPLDTIAIDMRPVLNPVYLPRSPLGLTVTALPTFLAPELFGPGSDTLIELPMTRYLRDLLQERGPDDAPPPTVLALLTGFEPWSLEYATFWGPGSELEPVVRLVLTVTDGLSLP